MAIINRLPMLSAIEQAEQEISIIASSSVIGTSSSYKIQNPCGLALAGRTPTSSSSNKKYKQSYSYVVYFYYGKTIDLSAYIRNESGNTSQTLNVTVSGTPTNLTLSGTTVSRSSNTVEGYMVVDIYAEESAAFSQSNTVTLVICACKYTSNYSTTKKISDATKNVYRPTSSSAAQMLQAYNRYQSSFYYGSNVSVKWLSNNTVYTLGTYGSYTLIVPKRSGIGTYATTASTPSGYTICSPSYHGVYLGLITTSDLT